MKILLDECVPIKVLVVKCVSNKLKDLLPIVPSILNALSDLSNKDNVIFVEG